MKAGTCPVEELITKVAVPEDALEAMTEWVANPGKVFRNLLNPAMHIFRFRINRMRRSHSPSQLQLLIIQVHSNNNGTSESGTNNSTYTNHTAPDDHHIFIVNHLTARNGMKSHTHRLNQGTITRRNITCRIQEITEGFGADVVIEAVGSPVTYVMAVDEVAFSGRVVCIGYAKSEVAFQTKYFVQKELDIRGSRNALPADFRAVINYMKAGTCPVEELKRR